MEDEWDEVRWLDVWERLRKAFPGEGRNQADPEYYGAKLSHFGADLVDVACDRLERTREYRSFPLVGEITRAVVEVVMSKVPSALDAWEEVTKGKPIANPVARRIVDGMGGRTALNASDSPSYDRGQFFKLYGAECERLSEKLRNPPGATLLLPERAMLLLGEGTPEPARTTEYALVERECFSCHIPIRFYGVESAVPALVDCNSCKMRKGNRDENAQT
jgi:hypothetical protein